MPVSSTLLLSALATSVVTASSLAQRASGLVSIPLTQDQGAVDLFAQTLRAAERRKGNAPTSPETLDGGFWYGNFDVGDSKNLSLIIDTGSPDVAVNPGLYKPSGSSENHHKSGVLEYITTEEDGCGNASIKYDTYSDTVSFAGLSVPNQVFGDVVKTTPPNNGTITQFPHSGIVGFDGRSAADTQIGGTPFFINLCNEKAVSECRFGLAYGTSGKGEQILGGVDSTLFSGSLSTAPITTLWETYANVAVNNKTVSKNISMVVDSGTANIVAPPDQVRQLFEKVGIQPVELNLPGCTSALFGYYKCDSPPTIGFSLGDGKPVFNIEPSAFQQADNGNNNCTAIITGIEGIDFWIVGQAWMQGKYVDFSVENNTLGFATLKNKAF